MIRASSCIAAGIFATFGGLDATLGKMKGLLYITYKVNVAGSKIVTTYFRLPLSRPDFFDAFNVLRKSIYVH